MLLYLRQELGAPYASVGEFLNWGGIDRYATVTLEAFFRGRGLSAEAVRAGLEPLNRAIYNRGGNAHAFSLLASLTAAQIRLGGVGGAALASSSSRESNALSFNKASLAVCAAVATAAWVCASHLAASASAERWKT